MDPKEPEGMLTLQSTIYKEDADVVVKSFQKLKISSSEGEDQRSANEIFCKISDAITQEEEVEALGRALEVEDIDQAKADNKDGVDSIGTFKMLGDWQGSRSINEVLPILRDALTKAKLNSKVPWLFQGAKKMGAYGGGEYHDVFLLSNGVEGDKNTIMEIANAKKWRVVTRNNFKLGEPVMETIESVLESSSYVIILVTEKNHKDPERKITIEMSFQEEFGTPYTKIIPIRCCNEDDVALRFKSKIGIAINDPNLKERLEEVITTRHRKERERQYSGM